jgi:hypothetical protein
MDAAVRTSRRVGSARHPTVRPRPDAGACQRWRSSGSAILAVAVALLTLPVTRPVRRPGRWLIRVRVAGGRVGVDRPDAQCLRYPPLGDRARTAPVGMLLGLSMAVGVPLGQSQRWRPGIGGALFGSGSAMPAPMVRARTRLPVDHGRPSPFKECHIVEGARATLLLLSPMLMLDISGREGPRDR